MRAVVAISVFAVLAVLAVSVQPTGACTDPLLPGMSVALTPATASVNFTSNQSISVKFNGTVKVTQNALSSMSIKITSAVDVGWAATCNPNTLSMKGSGSQTFLCTVTIPNNSTNSTGALTVTAQGNTRALLVTSRASANIQVSGLGNKTGNQTKQNTAKAGAGAGSKPGGMNLMIIAVVAVVIIVACAGAGFFLLRRRKARQPEMGAETAEQPYQADG